jgi:hypothetical protein
MIGKRRFVQALSLAVLVGLSLLLSAPTTLAEKPPTIEPRSRILLATGGGWITDQYGDKIHFGFNIDETGKGIVQKQCPWHVHSLGDMQIIEWTENLLIFSGDCRVNGEDGYEFTVQIMKASKNSRGRFKIRVTNPATPNLNPVYESSTEDIINCEISGGIIKFKTPPPS